MERTERKRAGVTLKNFFSKFSTFANYCLSAIYENNPKIQ